MISRGLLKANPQRRYFVIIEQGEPRWYDVFFAKGKAHCYLAIWDEFVWLIVHPTTSLIEVFLTPTPDGQFNGLQELIGPRQATVIETWPRHDSRARTPWIFAPVTCVEAVKACLGIRAFWVWTPAQLERYLRRTC